MPQTNFWGAKQYNEILGAKRKGVLRLSGIWLVRHKSPSKNGQKEVDKQILT